jgi:hypothetical protein
MGTEKYIRQATHAAFLGESPPSLVEVTAAHDLEVSLG